MNWNQFWNLDGLQQIIYEIIELSEILNVQNFFMRSLVPIILAF